MWQRLSTVCLVFFSSMAFAAAKGSLVQVDIILFSQNTMQSEKSLPAKSHLSNAVPIQAKMNKARTAFHLLPPSSSQLNNALWGLKRKPLYRVLAHYSWIQPKNNQKPVRIPTTSHDGWSVEGTLLIKSGSFYQVSTDLLFSPPYQPPFAFVQQQRLKFGKIYYFDHPQAGMLIKIHQVG